MGARGSSLCRASWALLDHSVLVLQLCAQSLLFPETQRAAASGRDGHVAGAVCQP